MKKLLLAAAMLLTFGIAAHAQAALATNTTGCDVEVYIYCYDKNCNLLSISAPILVPHSGSPTILLHPPCQQGSYTVFRVCWRTVCFPLTQCTMVDGTPGGVPMPCGTGTFTSQIQSCDRCNNGGGGIGYITYNPATNQLLITP